MRLRYGTPELAPAIEAIMPLGLTMPLITRMEAQKTLWRLWQDPYIRRKLRLALEKVPKPVLERIQKVVPFGEDILQEKAHLEGLGKRGVYWYVPPRRQLRPTELQTLEAAEELPGHVGEFYRTVRKGPVIGLAKGSWARTPETIFHEFGHHIYKHYLQPSEIAELIKQYEKIDIGPLEELTRTRLHKAEELFAQATAEYFYDRGLFEHFPRIVREIVKKSVERAMK